MCLSPRTTLLKEVIMIASSSKRFLGQCVHIPSQRLLCVHAWLDLRV